MACFFHRYMRQSCTHERKQFFMGIIKASKLIYDYIRRDEDDHVEEVKSARLILKTLGLRK